MIFISHKLDEVLEISDRISVLRGGRKVATEKTADCNPGDAGKPDGRPRYRAQQPARRAAGAAPVSPEPVLGLNEVSALTLRGDETRCIAYRCDVHAGEILGIAGVAGNGQRELSQVLAGIRPVSGGHIFLGGNDDRAP